MIVIVTDSTAYLTREEAAAMNVVVVPMNYSFRGGQSVSEGFIEEDSRACRQVAENIESIHTSQAPIAEFLSAFSRIRRDGNEVLCLTMSSRLSGTYSNAALAARELGGRHIKVVDSKTTCAGLYLLVNEAYRMVVAGEKVGDIAEKLSSMRERVRLAFSVDDMKPIRRSGRLGNVRMSVSTMLNIKPILEVREGAVVSAGLARGKSEQCNRLYAFCKKAAGKVIIDSFLGDEASERLLVRLAKDGREPEHRRTGPVLGAHLGRGCVGVAFIEAE